MLQVSLVSFALFLFPLLVQCAPMTRGDQNHHLFNNLVITETVFSTYTETGGRTVTFTTMASSSPSTPITSPTPLLSPVGATNADIKPSTTPDAVLFFPPPAATPLSSDRTSAAATSTSESSLEPTPTPYTALDAPRPQVMVYYPEWAGSEFPPEKLDFNRLDWIDFAFAVLDKSFNLGWDGSDDAPQLLNRLVTSAHAKGKKVKLSIGGWSGSKYFSTAVATPANRQKLSANILAVYKQFHLDGVDIDWEYPGQGGNDGNRVSPSDTANFLTFLQTLRTTLPVDAKITAATMTVPFADSHGNPLRDVSEFAKVLDWILIMNYDTWGSSSPPGPNAPLNDGCHNSTQPQASAMSAVDTWTKAGFPAAQIVLGVPSYGYISRSSATTLRTRSLAGHRHGSSDAPGSRIMGLSEALPDAELVTDVYEDGVVLVTNEDNGTDDGQVQFRELIRQGVLKYIPDSDTTDEDYNSRDPLVFAGRTISNLFAGYSGFTRFWDQCSNTPFLRSEHAKQIVSYDDPQSLEIKATFAKEAGLLGVNMFDVHGDSDHWDLIDGLRRGLGL